MSIVAFVGAATTASAGRACLSGARAGGYSYAGHQAAYRGHGVRATIMLTRAPSVDAGHVAGWVGVGGPGQGANGGDAWIQAGVASVPPPELEVLLAQPTMATHSRRREVRRRVCIAGLAS